MDRHQRDRKIGKACNGTQERAGVDLCPRKVICVVTYGDGWKRGYCRTCAPTAVPSRVTFIGGR